MLNKKGFSILELVISFSICMVILIMLFQIVIVLRESYEKSLIKTELYNKQNLIIEQIYSDIGNINLISVGSCGDNCVTFNYQDGTSKNLTFDSSNISYGDYSTSILNGTTIGEIEFSTENSVTHVLLPITHQLFSGEDFGINIVLFNV